MAPKRCHVTFFYFSHHSLTTEMKIFLFFFYRVEKSRDNENQTTTRQWKGFWVYLFSLFFFFNSLATAAAADGGFNGAAATAIYIANKKKKQASSQPTTSKKNDCAYRQLEKKREVPPLCVCVCSTPFFLSLPPSSSLSLSPSFPRFVHNKQWYVDILSARVARFPLSRAALCFVRVTLARDDTKRRRDSSNRLTRSPRRRTKPPLPSSRI